MNYWLHRISYIAGLSYPLLEKGYLTIGWSHFTDQEFIDKVLANERKYFELKFKKKWSTLPRSRHSLWRFLRFKKGDIIIVPTKGAFCVCEIIDERPLIISETYSEELRAWGDKKITTNGTHLISDTGNVYDLGFARKVKVIHKNVSRAKYADAKLTSRLKIRQTNSSIDDLKKNVEKSIENYIHERPIHLHSIIIEKTAALVLEAIKTELNPDKFQKLIKIYFNTIGANEVSIPAKNERNKEGDADIVAVFETIKLIIYVQAKFHRGQIDEEGTNQILDYKTNKESIDDGYNKIAWVITSANSFNEATERLATENEIQLINGLDFSKMLLNAGINLLTSNL